MDDLTKARVPAAGGNNSSECWLLGTFGVQIPVPVTVDHVLPHPGDPAVMDFLPGADMYNDDCLRGKDLKYKKPPYLQSGVLFRLILKSAQMSTLSEVVTVITTVIANAIVSWHAASPNRMVEGYLSDYPV
ncbi:MAG: hypothetical protein ACYC6B_07045 [Thermoleophilia bacterium]